LKLSVVILNYKVPYFLELCLQSVQAAILNIEAEIIVVDNLSQDHSCDMVRQKFPPIKLIENAKNYGFSKGNNLGVAEAKGEYICILNPDTVVAEDTFEILLNSAENKKDLGIIGCKLIDGKGDYLPESKRNVPIPKIAIQKILGNSKSYYASHVNENASGKVSIFVGAFMLLKKSVYNTVNGFDEDYFMYGEDIDLSYKIEKKGYHNFYVGLSTTIHYKGESTLKDEVYAKRFYGAMQIFYKKHFKQNLFFDSLVYIGIKGAKLLNKKATKITGKSPNFVLVSDKMHSNLNKKLGGINLAKMPVAIKGETEYILDANYLSFKKIITIMSNAEKNKGTTFKILPKNSNFILGSNSSKTKGEIITF